jgi:hypothetical protein
MTDHTPILESACRFYQEHLKDEHRAFLTTKYGYTPTTVDNHRIGYAPEDTWELPAWLLEQGFSSSEIRTSGLVWTSDDGNCGSLMRGRILFPYIVNGNPSYFIGRQTDATPPLGGDSNPPKYKKMKTLKDTQGYVITPQEPVFGIDSVQNGQPLIITEGIADCISAHQAGYAAISPGTIRFKEDHLNEVLRLCKIAAKTYIVMDNEENESGLHGAIDTGLKLCRHGVLPYIATIPRNDTVEKIDLNDYIREGGDVRDLFTTAVYVEEHPAAVEVIHNEWKQTAAKLLSQVLRGNQQITVPHGNANFYNRSYAQPLEKKLERIFWIF